MTNFDVRELHKIWDNVQEFVSENWNLGRGRKTPQGGKVVLLFTLTAYAVQYLRTRVSGTSSGRLFNIPGPTFERLVMRYIFMVSDTTFVNCTSDFAESCTMRRLINEKKTFNTFKFCRYATDVTFQQPNRPTGK